MTRLVGDVSDFQAVNDVARDTPWLHSTVVAYATYGVALFALLLLAGWLLARRQDDARRMAAALIAPLGVLLAVAANQPIVHAVNEARPHTVLPHALLLVHASTDGSFPSDHATMAGATAAGLFLVSRKLGVIAAAAAVLMALSRVYVGAHFPVDVVAGLAFGAAIAALVGLALTGPGARLVDHLRGTAMRPLLVSRGSAPAA